jgi:hypothetical protein
LPKTNKGANYLLVIKYLTGNSYRYILNVPEADKEAIVLFMNQERLIEAKISINGVTYHKIFVMHPLFH